MTKDDPAAPGFLSRMAQLVRQPMRDWAQLDQTEPEPEPDHSYSKETLKAMIERKRQNDFVRRREFDHLRKIRSRDTPVMAEQAGRPSFFHTSLPSNLDEREQTLKKIDEIEAQMSRQWWRGKQGGRSPGQPGQASAPLSTDPTQRATSPDTDFAPTEASVPFARTDLPTDFSPTVNTRKPSPEQPLAMEHPPTDPVLEAAAIRFANGDWRQAQSFLRRALEAAPEAQALPLMWTLIDLYRASGQPAEIERLRQQMAHRFSGVPLASSVHGPQAPTPAAASAFVLQGDVLGEAAAAITALKHGAQSEWVVEVDCSGLTRLDFSAAGGLLSWAAERQAQSVLVRFIHVNRLIAIFFNVIGIAEHAQVHARTD